MHQLLMQIADLTGDSKLADKVSEAYISCAEDERDELLYYLLALHPGRTLVFANAISGVRRATALLKLLGLPCQVLQLHHFYSTRRRHESVNNKH